MASTRFLDVSFSDLNQQVQKNTPVQNDAPMPFGTTPIFWIPVKSAKHLTSGEDVKTVIDLSLDISDLNIKPIVGDTIGILPKNPSAKIEYLFQRLSVTKDADRVCHINVLKNTRKKNASVPNFIPQCSTLRHIFETCVDLQFIPKKLFLKSLLEHTSDSSDQACLEDLCARESDAYNTWISSGQASIFNILERCPSCNPPVALLLEHLPRLLPRPYSISYTSGKDKHIHVLFSVLKPDGIKHKSVGLCSGWLEELIKPHYLKTQDIVEDIQHLSLNERKSSDDIKIPIFFRKSNGFNHPTDPTIPLIMVGPGTGVAPFLGFLQHREKIVDQIGKNGVGESWLFFGCRYSNRDNIFQKEILDYQTQGALTRYVVSYSREGGDVKYVQDNIKLFSKELCHILLEKNGMMFVCGDSSTMGKDVKECMAEEISKIKGTSKEEANEILKNLIGNRRYVEDLWS